MEAERQQSIVSSLPILAMLAIIAGAYYVSRLPLKSSRPESPLGLEHVVPEKDKIDARLWQDPLKVALDHENAMHREKQVGDNDPRWNCMSQHCVSQVTERIDKILKENGTESGASIVHVLLIIVRDGNFTEDHERRLRNRYAVLTALYASGLAPDDSKHIQYLKLLWTEEDELEKGIKDENIPKITPVLKEKSRTIIVPFEWFECPKFDPEKQRPEYPDSAAVVWLPESAFSHRPLTRLAQIIDALNRTCSDGLKIDIIGPSYSDTLLAMLKEIEHRRKLKTQKNTNEEAGKVDKQGNNTCFVDVNSMLCGITIFSPWSTASPALLIREADPNTDKIYNSLSEMYGDLSEKFQFMNIDFQRTIGSDDLLALELIRELHRRGVDDFTKSDSKKDANDVALICEWDTFYGRTFPLVFAAMMKAIDPDHPEREPNWITYTKNLISSTRDDKINLRVSSYIRGVDGKLLQSQTSEEKQSGEKTESESKWTYTKNLELPIDRGQLDYVRRLSQNIKDDSKGSKLEAIGVVGSDVYDKLILLHALREEFAEVILFMTDLDARLMHHEQFKWTRNVIVASNFGLRLNEKYHSAPESIRSYLPPFRDNYQTSLFFTCQVALGLSVSNIQGQFRELGQKELTKYISLPRLFEIGRDHAVDISVSNGSIHPMPRSYPAWDTVLKLLFQIVIALIFGVLLLALINSKVSETALGLKNSLVEVMHRAWYTNDGKSEKEERKEKGNTFTLAAITIVSISASIALVALVLFDHYRYEGEPFSIVTGVSIWPGEALRLIATVLSVYFLTKSMSDLREGSKKLHKHFLVNCTF